MLFAYRKFTVIVALLLTIGIALFMTGCTDNAQVKQELLQAVSKQEQIVNYRFQGSIELKADASLIGQASPVTAALFALLKDSKIEYKGVSSLEPSRMETTLNVTPNGGSAIAIPVIIKDSKLFFHMPPLNKQDEYMVLPIASGLPAASGANGSADPLKNTGHLTAELTKQLLNGIDPKWLVTAKDQATLQDGTPVKSITIDVNKKNEQAFNDYLKATVIPGLMNSLKTNGLSNAGTLDSFTASLQQIKLHAPSSINLRIGNDGYIREQTWSLVFATGTSTNENKLVWTQTLSEVNQNPAFTQETPAKQKSLDELLRLVKPAPADAGKK
ncbi:hypothetical protein DVH26_26070 [Paenibacillus sp. H1-7]|uniref:hypothetical protein n=1 Tax=Paenibacillus sp. H1-7 TaxID=2282849 RepID=UPI001EF80722|nr:hypothetical protein [Paenibacillus sp. H1-7]ULL17615.1 hypothetical protein DVH26_26070 [Paenibacillus sp. H1-7]